MRLILLLSFLLIPFSASAQTCPEPLASARKLVLVTPETWTSSTAEVQRFSRTSAKDAWHSDGSPVSALVGLKGVGWSRAFRRLARAGEPLKQEGDARAPAGFFEVGRSFGFAPSALPGYLEIQADTVCVSDPRSSAYNTITARSLIGPDMRVENMRAAARVHAAHQAASRFPSRVSNICKSLLSAAPSSPSRQNRRWRDSMLVCRNLLFPLPAELKRE